MSKDVALIAGDDIKEQDREAKTIRTEDRCAMTTG